MPRGIPYIIANDVAERFSFYGMHAILVIFMTQYLMTGEGEPDTFSNEDATSYFHLFTATAYFLPIIGAVISDAFLRLPCLISPPGKITQNEGYPVVIYCYLYHFWAHSPVRPKP